MEINKRFLISSVAMLVIIMGMFSGCAGLNKSYQPTTKYNAHPDRDAYIANSRNGTKSYEANSSDTVPERSAEEYERMGDLSFSRGNLPMAFTDYEKALKLDPENIIVHYKVGLLFLAGGLNEDAIHKFKGILDKDQQFALAHEGLGQAYFHRKEFKLAEASLRKALDLDSKLWKSHNLLGILYDYQKNNVMATSEYSAAIRLKPDKGFLYHNLGVSYALAGENEKAISAFQNALARNYKPKKTFNNLGMALAITGKDNEALEALKKGGSVAQAHNNLGCIYLTRGEFQKAIDYFKKAIEASPVYYAKANENLKNARMAALK